MQGEIFPFVWKQLVEKGVVAADAVPDPQFEYAAAGRIDSLGLVLLVAAVEEHFGIGLRAQHMQDPRFLTVGGLVAIITELLGERQSPSA
ncbi:hypothetical protein DSECCO2_602770 [anaerobic digester metagenome]